MSSHICSANQAAVGVAECELLIAAYILAGLAMMLNIRLSYSSAPYALIRFRLPENLFSVFVRRMASALELWCLPSMLLGNIMDLIQKLAIDTDVELKETAGASPASAGTLRQLAGELYTRANGLNTAVNTASTNAAKVLKFKAGASETEESKLRKLAKTLYEKAEQLDTNTPSGTTDGPALQKKAGTTENDGLRFLARELYDRANALATAVGNGQTGYSQASTLATAVGNSESDSDKLRQTLKDLATDGSVNLSRKVGAVTGAYSSVQGAFQQVETQKTTHSAYKNHQAIYEAVKKAWEAFDALYTTNLKQLATDLKNAVGTTSAGDKLQKTLQDLGDHSGLETELPGKATKVRDAYKKDDSSGVKDKFDALKAKQSSYQAIAAIRPLYDSVVSAMDAFDAVYRPEELLIEAVGATEGTGAGSPNNLREALRLLHDAGPRYLTDMAQDVKDKFAESFGPTVKSKFHLVQAQAPAYENGNTIKTNEYKELLEAWTKFNDMYYKVISSPKYNTIIIPSIITQWLNFLTYVVLLIVYVVGGEQGHITIFYWTIAISGVVFGINMTLVYSVDFNYIPVYIAGENCFPILTSFIHYLTTLMFGNRRKWNSDFIVVYVDIVVAIAISLVAAVVWTYAYVCKIKYFTAPDTDASGWHHIFSHGFSGNFNPEVISPFLMIVVGMGLVYAIYPGIAPGMIVPFYLVDKIEMVLLIATFFPPVIVACLRRFTPFGDPRSPMCKWDSAGFLGFMGSGLHWHTFDLLMVIKITLAIIFIYSLHYRDSHISRSIINQPKMSTALSITFYMCHECLLALGFPGLVGANGGGDYVLIPQYIGALFMIFLAFYSEGYIIEYKSHDLAHSHK